MTNDRALQTTTGSFGARARAVIAALIAVSAMSDQAVAQTKPLKPVTIAVGTTVINVTYPWLTLPIALGYWRDEGYDVKLVTVGGSLQAVQQMVAGSVDFSQLLFGSIIQANTESNVPVRGIMGTAAMDWGIGVLPNGPIRSITDLKGKKLGTFSLGTGGLPMIKAYMRANGMNPDTDVEIIATGAGAPALEALRSDRVQAIALWGAALASFENAGTKLTILRDPSWRTLPDFTFATLQKTIDSDPAMVEAIARGTAKATLFATTNPMCALRIHWKNYPGSKPTGADEATLVKWDLTLLTFQLEQMKNAYELNGGKLIGNMVPENYGRMQDILLKEGVTKRSMPAETFVINRPGFFQAVNRFDSAAVVQAAKECKGY